MRHITSLIVRLKDVLTDRGVRVPPVVDLPDRVEVFRLGELLVGDRVDQANPRRYGRIVRHRLEQHHRHVLELLAGVCIFLPAADRGEELPGTLEC